MSYLDHLSADFDDEARIRGAEYLQRGVVHIRKVLAGTIRAHVIGTRTYAVRIEWEAGGKMDYECSCPASQDNGTHCRHAWATLMAADKQGLLGQMSLPSDREIMNTPSVSTVTAAAAAKNPAWKQRLARLRQTMRTRIDDEVGSTNPLPSDRKIMYVVEQPPLSGDDHGVVIELCSQEFDEDEHPQPIKPLRIAPQRINDLPEESDRKIIGELCGSERADSAAPRGATEIPKRYHVADSSVVMVLRDICETGRAVARKDRGDHTPTPIVWDDGPAWQFWMNLVATPEEEIYQLQGELRRGREHMAIADAQLLLRAGLVISNGTVARFEHFGAYDLTSLFRDNGVLIVPVSHLEEIIRELYTLPRLPRLDLPEDHDVEEIRVAPKPRLSIRPPGPGEGADAKLIAELSFDYDGTFVNAAADSPAVLQMDKRRAVVRDLQVEQAARQVAVTAGLRADSDPGRFRVPATRLARAVTELAGRGWHIEAEGKLYRKAGEFRADVRSGVDWFDLSGQATFDDQVVPLPRLLEALRKGETTIRLDDGTLGILPEEWLKRYAPLAAMAENNEGSLRFSAQQIGFLDALLAASPEATFDDDYQKARDKLLRFEKIESIEPPEDFKGQLRPYQKEGLGWIHFLQQFNFGGCLADDMGLGKTVQVLGLLAARAGKGKPSLVVVPRSLVFNWKQEAARFTPNIKLLDHTGVARNKSADKMREYDVIVTTYGTLRLDAPFLKDVDFDYVILDEAQVIKNASTESAKAVRLLRGAHRLALSGTPIENHLGELWSLFEFLNPGLLGRSALLSGATSAAKVDIETRQVLARALRPFILRRTKEQVARDLPEKLEQTIICDLEPEQRKLYDELRQHYRTTLLDMVNTDGLNNSKMHILEALLRLRQAACHPALIDKTNTEAPSAKLDELIPRLIEAAEEGHKVLVFSQFTSFLALVQKRLDDAKLTYEYLDGKTRDRQARVERFQNDPSCKLFLISLRAGGLGLNLTAADYVFLLDPWWNPAVEQQAIDRAHRIGQTRRVFAYRLIARDTVEEKVLELQTSKRDLAEAIITADNSLIRNLAKEDLELLLS